MSPFNIPVCLLLILGTFKSLFLSVEPRVLKQDEIKQISEKVYLHTDRDFYTVSDDIWFKSYIIDAATNKLSANTNNLHVELISPGALIIQNRIVRIENGIGNGDFHLADSLPSGKYRIRAYTNHMRNFDDHLFFIKDIVVINPLDGGNRLNDSSQYVKKGLHVTFFPEGGSLVDNISSVVAFKATDALGASCNISGEVLSSSGEHITSFKSIHLGMGFFILTPKPGLNYFAVIKTDDSTEYKADIPKSFARGINIHTLLTSDYKLLLKVSATNETIDSLLNRELAVSISSRNLITKIFNIRLSSEVNNYLIPLEEFPDGIIRVTVAGTGGLPLCERLVFLQRNPVIEPKLSFNKNVFRPREQVKFLISMPGDSVSGNLSFLSLSAAKTPSLRNSEGSPTNISSWFLLESDVHGPVEEPSYYFDNSNDDRFEKLDLLLLTQGWRDFKWKYDGKKSFSHEIGFTLTGNAKRIFSNKALKGAKINAGIFSDRGSSFLSEECDSLGNFRISGLDLTGRIKAVLSLSDKRGVFNGWLVLDSIKYKPADIEIIDQITRILPVNKYAELKRGAITRTAEQRIFKLSDTIAIDEVIVTSRKWEEVDKLKASRSHYITPDQELIFTPDMENRPSIYSVMAGRIPGVEASMEGVTVRGQTPLVLLDGVPGTPAEDVFMMPPYMIDRIDVLYWSSLYGSEGANGIINVITKRGDYRYKPSIHTSTIVFKGFDAPRIFYSPDYNVSEMSPLSPDLRNTIFWKPDLMIGAGQSKALTWFNADRPASVDVRVEGMNNRGVPVTAKARYEIK
jgi:hypothetical protein